MLLRMMAVLILCSFCGPIHGDELDEPPAMDEDPRCLARKAALETYLKSIDDAPVAKGNPCPPDPEKIRQRELACRAGSESKQWKFIADGFEADSSMLSKGVPYVIEKLGEPLLEEPGEGFWDIDIYEMPRTLYFPGVVVETRDYVDDAVNFQLDTGHVKTSNAIYAMRVESGDFQFAYGLSLESSRDDVEAALGLPCRAVANFGRKAVRKKVAYSYNDPSDEQRARYSVTFNFNSAQRIKSVRWFYDSVWH